MLTFFSWVAFALFVVGTIIIITLLHGTFQFQFQYQSQFVKSTSPGINDDASAISSFLGMLDEAQESLIIYDDGDNSDGSLYNDPRVIEAVRGKLRDNPAFSLRCLFNCDDDVLFRRELSRERQVQIRSRHGSVPSDGIHYKIIDGGAKSYLSRQDLGSKARRFKIVDCTRVAPRHRGSVADSVVGIYKEDFKHAFEASAPAH